MARGLSLHIGLNSVNPAHYAGWNGALAACEADAADMEQLARSRGYTPTTLLTAAGTRARLLQELNRATQTLVAGDAFLLTYSGHGGKLPDRNGDEDDSQDETWCMYDGQVVDDELNATYARFKPGVRVTVLSDSCHSGTVAKFQFYETLAETAAAPDEPKPRFRAMPSKVALDTYKQNREMYEPILEDAATRAVPSSSVAASVILISGCQDDQLSLDGTFNGLFTGNLLRVWNKGSFNGALADLHKEISRRMPPTQTPNLFRVGAVNHAFESAPCFTI